MTISAYRGRCPHCGHDHDQILFHTSDREELDRLRAEVASLKKENENLKAYAKHERSLGAEPWMLQCNDLTQQLADTQQKLADANENVRLMAEQSLKYQEAAHAANAKIDTLMLEYCPNEMTKEQMDNWAAHQRRADLPEADKDQLKESKN